MSDRLREAELAVEEARTVADIAADNIRMSEAIVRFWSERQTVTGVVSAYGGTMCAVSWETAYALAQAAGIEP